ncbi:Oidioi.mRNA.OKI2018_I69.YSR.g17150.t1.cds [Oikopleura dioica]|uniref:Oidioi.mRNA.OKI2018_I69.YSR.g17150.t1.cds n=1 Tax=Oikopleura dioica TaxID=34765 RepID=A0ABN7SM24_OIKDI|nr:Oidioi.mRNA.OKI2018_I69.YSR.g17150.t1.cds [Oikopleura dioica]
MFLTLEEAEDKLIEKGLTTREEIDADKKTKRAVKDDEENFFFQRDQIRRDSLRKLLVFFEMEGRKTFLANLQKRKTTAPNYCETDEETEEPAENALLRAALQANQFFIKESQESKGKGKGSNNPQLSKTSKHKLMRQVASGDSIASIQRNNQNYFDDFEIFHYSPDNKTTARANLDILNITLINEKKEQLLFDILLGHGKDGENTSQAIIASVEQDEATGMKIWEKVDTILSDTFTGQINANERLLQHIRLRRNDPNAPIEVLWCILHTCSNLDKKGHEGQTTLAQECLQEIKILFGSPTNSGFHKFDIKNDLSKEIEARGGGRNKFPFTTDLGSRMGTARQNAENLIIHYQAVMAALKRNENTNTRAKNLLSHLGKEGVLPEIAIVVFVWSAFCGPILRTAEKEESTIQDVKTALRTSSEEATRILQCDSPFDTLYLLASTNSSRQKFYRDLDLMMKGERSDTVSANLNAAALASINKLKYKIEKDFAHYQTLTVEGLYVCCNRFAESVFGLFKETELHKSAASTDTIVQMTIARMNNLQNFFRSMTKTQVERLWKKIDSKTALSNYHAARKATQVKLQNIANRRKERIAEEKAKKLEKKEAKRIKKEMQTPVRSSLPRKKKLL